MRTLVLGLGNDLLADDAVGIHAVRALRGPLAGYADVVETSMHGVALLEFFVGYDRAVLVDAICTGKAPPGTVMELEVDALKPIVNPSPHFAGLPEMIALARELELDFPREFRIVAMEVADPFTVGGKMSVSVRNALPYLIQRVHDLIFNFTEVAVLS